MQMLGLSARRCAIGLLLAMFAFAMSFVAANATCEFAVVKQQIDIVLDRDAEKAATFRREVISGADSIAALESLVSLEMREKIDICRFETAEYLTKRGYPPFH